MGAAIEAMGAAMGADMGAAMGASEFESWPPSRRDLDTSNISKYLVFGMMMP